MKLLLKLTLKNPLLPMDYRKVIMSYIKSTLSAPLDGKFFNQVYDVPKVRPLTFAVRLPNPNFADNKIILSANRMEVTISTGDQTLGYVFFSALIGQKRKAFKMPLENQMTLSDVTQLRENLSGSDKALVKMLSPLCLREHFKEEKKDIYYSVNSKNFSEKSYEILCRQLKNAGFSDELSEGIRLVPILSKKTVVTHYGSKIECSLGNFVIQAKDKAVINHFLKYGIGSRKSAGFGFAELISDGLEV